MGRSRKFDYQALILDELAQHPEGVTLDELLRHAELEVDRSTLFRHLARLIEQGRAQRMGNARASRYSLPGAAWVAANQELPEVPQPTARCQPKHPSDDPRAEAARADQSQPAVEADGGPIETLEHGAVVRKAVRRIVREWKRCNRLNLEIYLSLMVRREQVDALATVVERELAGLHQGNLSRFGLTQADFDGFVPPPSPQTPGG